MKLTINKSKASRKAGFLHKLTVTSLVVCAFILTGIQTPLQAQGVQYEQPSWWFGVAVGGNLNFYRGSTQQLNTALTVPTAFHNSFGVGLYLAPLIEFHRPDSRWGVMFQAGVDNRKGTFDQVITPCNCPADLSTDMVYLTFEPSLRFAPFKSNFYLYAGPRLAYSLESSFLYEQGTNPDYPEQTEKEYVNGNFSDVNKLLVSMQIGAGYDFMLMKEGAKTPVVLSPYVSFQPWFGQDPRNIETWNITTVRAGIALKLGRGKAIPATMTSVMPMETAESLDKDVVFSVVSPGNIPVDRKVREVFPLRNYIFFDLNSTEISDRYVLLNKNQVKEFKEDQLDTFRPKTLSGRSDRQMIVYYNVLNILGDRMQKNPSATIKLVGSSETGTEDGREMAESVKIYLVDIFGIKESRIETEGRIKPIIPSEKPGSTSDLVLLREGDRRVSIESSSPDLLMEFQSGPAAPLRSVEFYAIQEAPLDSYVTFKVEGAEDAFTSWSLKIEDEDGKTQKFGPFTNEKVSIPGRSILGKRPEGDFKVTMIGETPSGNTVKKVTSTHMVLWKPAENEEGMRYSIIYEFDESNAIPMYEKYLTEVVVPKIPHGGTVILHGHTDIIGDTEYNQTLSMDRANDVRGILEKGLANIGRKDVQFEVFGFGEDEALSLFDNKYPEERFYNRTVIIDIIPAVK